MKKSKACFTENPQKEHSNSTAEICYSSKEILEELQGDKQPAGFSKEVPFRNSPPYFDFPFTQFSDFKNR